MAYAISRAHKIIIRASLLCATLVFATGCGVIQTALSYVTPPTPTAPAPLVVAPTTAPRPTVSTSTSSSSADTVRIAIVPSKSQARYRVREQLVNVSLPGDAIGNTREISGTIVGKMDGTIVSAQSKFRVDLRTLQSDRGQRDQFLRFETLETNRYPYAEFVPIEAQGLTLTLPPSGEVQFKLIGDMTIRNVTKRVTWDIKAKVEGNEATGLATTNFNFAYFNLNQPRVPSVLSVEDIIRLELDFTLQRVI